MKVGDVRTVGTRLSAPRWRRRSRRRSTPVLTAAAMLAASLVVVLSATHPASAGVTGGGAKAVAITDTHACAIKGDDVAVCWGESRIAGSPPANLKATAVAAGKEWSCAVKQLDSKVTCWGDALDPPAGKTYQSGATLVPTDVGPVDALSAGIRAACAIQSSTKFGRCWGDGLPSALPQDLVTTPLKAISQGTETGWDNVCAIRADDTVRCWGYPDYSGRFTPSSYGGTDGGYMEGFPPPDLGAVSAVSNAGNRVCVIMKSDSHVRCWKRGDRQFPGSPTFYPYASEVTSQVPTSVGAVSAIGTESYGTCAIQTPSGTLVCWANEGDTQWTPPPAGLTTVTALSVRRAHYCVVKSDGAVTCWQLPSAPGNAPYGYFGELGVPPPPATPAPVAGLSGVAYTHTFNPDPPGSGGGIPTSSVTNAPSTFVVSAGALPPGLTLSTAGVISGTPTTPGTFNFTVKTFDGLFEDGFANHSIVITRATATWSWSSFGVPGSAGAVNTRPPRRSLGAMAYDVNRKKTVLFGGNALPLANVTPQTPAVRNDTWEFDGVAWVLRAPTAPGPLVQNAAMTYDGSARHESVLFGGQDGSGVTKAETWTYDGNTWTLKAPAASPPARRGAAIAYDSGRSKVVLFGGTDANNVDLNDVWTWDGTTWAMVSPTGGPPPARPGPEMTYDVVRQELVAVVEGPGYDSSPANYAAGETWVFDAAAQTWTNKTGASQPPGRRDPSLAYASSVQAVVLHGGLAGGTADSGCATGFKPSGAVGSPRCDTWTWNGTVGQWAQESPAVSPRQGRSQATMVFDQAHGEMVLFGGAGAGVGGAGLGDDTWTYTYPVTDTSRLSVYVTDVNVAEAGGNAVFTVSTNQPVPAGQEVAVTTATANSTAVAGLDYTAKAAAKTIIAAGTTSTTVSVPVTNDTLHEKNETFKLNLTLPVLRTANSTTTTSLAPVPLLADTSGTATILDDDGLFSIAVTDAPVVEGNTGTNTPANFVVTVSPPVPAGETVTVNYATAGVNAVDGPDYNGTSGTLSFNGNGSQTVAVNVVGNTAVQANRTFKLNLSVPSANALLADTFGLGTILDDDTNPTPTVPVSITVGDINVAEGSGGGDTPAIFKVKLSRALNGAELASVTVTTANTTATAKIITGTTANVDPPTYDYTPVPTTVLQFSPSTPLGADSLPFIDVAAPVRGDALHEVNETFKLNLSLATGAVLADTSATATILDDEGPFYLYARQMSVAEGNPGGANRALMSVTLSDLPQPGETVMTKFATAAAVASATIPVYPAAGTDYTARGLSGLVPFDSTTGTTQVIPVAVTGDLLHEWNESFLLNLSVPSTNAVLADSSGTAQINDEEGPFTVRSGTPAVAGASYGDGPAITTEGNLNPDGTPELTPAPDFTVTITPTPIAGESVAVTWATIDCPLINPKLPSPCVSFNGRGEMPPATGSTNPSTPDYTKGSGTVTLGAGVSTVTVAGAATIVGDTVLEGEEGYLFNLSGTNSATNPFVFDHPQTAGQIINDDN